VSIHTLLATSSLRLSSECTPSEECLPFPGGSPLGNDVSPRGNASARSVTLARRTSPCGERFCTKECTHPEDRSGNNVISTWDPSGECTHLHLGPFGECNHLRLGPPLGNRSSPPGTPLGNAAVSAWDPSGECTHHRLGPLWGMHSSPPGTPLGNASHLRLGVAEAGGVNASGARS
jgi:hypothetical protein